jgi:hypothetical protein
VSVIDQGNPNLDSEVADTTTFGVVLSFDQLELSVDWYQIEIEDIIGSISYDTVPAVHEPGVQSHRHAGG